MCPVQDRGLDDFPGGKESGREQAFGRVRVTGVEEEARLWATCEVLGADWGVRDGVRVHACVCMDVEGRPCGFAAEQRGQGQLLNPQAPVVPPSVPLLRRVWPVSA